MNLLTILLLLGSIVVAKGQDPTVVCYPPVFQTVYYNLITEDRGTISVEFAKQKFAEVSSVTGNRYIHDFANDMGIISVDFGKEKFSEVSSVSGHHYIHDFTNLKSYAIAAEGNITTCKSFKLQQSQVMNRCLPPFARLVSKGSGFFHHLTTKRLTIQTWDTDTESDVILRVSFSVITGQPYWPVLSQEYGYHGTRSVYMYLNPMPNVRNQSVFTVPAECITPKIQIAPIAG